MNELEWPTGLSGEGTRGQGLRGTQISDGSGFCRGWEGGVGYYSSCGGKSLKSRTIRSKKMQIKMQKNASDDTKSGHGRGGLSDCQNDHPVG